MKAAVGMRVAPRPVGNLIAVLCCLLSGWASWGVEAEPQVFPVSTEYLPVTRIAVHPQSGRVYIGANNYVARLSPDLTLLESAQLGNDSAEDVASGSRQVWILKIFPTLGRLLVCWQEDRCVCRTHSLHNITVTEDTWLEELTCSEHSVAVIYPRDGNETNGTRNVLLAAPWPGSAQVLSFLTLSINTTSATSSLVFASAIGDGVSHVRGQKALNDSITFVYGFVDEDFTYLVTVQPELPLSPKAKVSRISRVCHNRLSVLPYAEVELNCTLNGKIYRIATAARLARIPSDRSSTNVLIVSFVENEEALRNSATVSAVCVYQTTNIQNAMTGVLTGLYPSLIAPWIAVNHTKNKSVSEDKVCESHTARRGQDISMEELGGAAVLQLQGQLVTSIQSVTQQGTTSSDQLQVILMATSVGQLLQYNVTAANYMKIWQPDRVYNITPPWVTWSDSGIFEDNVYVSTNDTVYRENWALEPEYKDCEACVTDTESRQWCQGRCRLRGSHTCKESWQERTCPPEISQIKPTGGLKGGGTVLTILGKKLGTLPKKVEVKICNVPCTVLSANLTKVTCQTPAAQPERHVCTVTIRVNETNSESSRVNLRGSDTAQQNFSYQDPVLTTLKPPRGPRSGGTHLTITSTGLRPGDDVTVFLGLHATCQDARATETEITCITSPLEADEELPLPATVNVTAAVGGFNFTGNTTFRYDEDPQITNIEPRRSIASGGLNITVTGTNLDVIAHPRMGLKTPGANEENTTATEPCTVNNGGVSMTCPSPNAKDVVQDKKAEIFFLMDGVESLNNFSAYNPKLSVMEVLPDPTVAPDASKANVVVDPRKNSRLQLEIMGLKGVVPEDQISVTIGQSACRGLEVTDTHVSCDLQAWPNTNMTESSSAYPVVIKIGRLEISLGKVQISHKPGDPMSGPGNSVTILVGAVVGGVSFCVLVLVLCCVCIRCARTHSHKSSHDVYSMESSNTEMVAFKSRTGIVDPAKIKMVENSGLLIKKDHLRLGDCVGEGNFGCVYVGHFIRQGGEDKVAVKTLRDEDSQSVNMNDFVEEALMMKDFSDPNVLNLVGIAFGEGSLPLVVLPFMERGDLHSFIADWHNDVTVLDVIKFGRDIASGMAYLSSLKFVHRDLAARNCMLESDLRVKVADFGLCRNIYEKGYYHSDNKKSLPIRWMSLESIDRGTYSSKSDVWSLGVVLWELFTRGVTPYPGVDGWDIARFLRAGRRLDQPWFCPTSVYELMLSCWMEEPSSRPNFPDIRETLDQIHANQESNMDQGVYVTLGECARYQNITDASGYGSYFVLEDPSQTSSPDPCAPSSPTGQPLPITSLQISSMTNPPAVNPALFHAAASPLPQFCNLPDPPLSFLHNPPIPSFSDLPPPPFLDPPPPSFPESSAAPLPDGECSAYANEKLTGCSLAPPSSFMDAPPPSQPKPPPPASSVSASRTQPSTYIPGLKTNPSSPPPSTQTFTFPVTHPASRPVPLLSTFAASKPPLSQTQGKG